MPKNQIGGLTVLVALVVFLIGIIGAYSFGSNNAIQNQQDSPQYITTKKTNQSLSNNVLSNSVMHLQFFYPVEYRAVTEVDGMVTVSKDQLGSDGISFIPKSHPNFVETKDLELCSMTNKTELSEGAGESFCLSGDSKVGNDIEISGVKLKSFSLSYPSRKHSFQILQTINNPIIQIWPSDPNESDIVFKQLIEGIHIN